MIPARNIEAHKVEIGELESLIERMPDDPLSKPVLKSRLEEMRKELQAIEQAPVTKPETELLFAGSPVVGSMGIEARFAASILKDYQDMLANHHAGSQHGGAGTRGRRPGEDESRVFLSALPRGSFGLLLTQPNIDDFVTAIQVSEEMEQITGLIQSATNDDASFADTIFQFDPRVLKPLQRFFETMENSRATVNIRTGRKTITMNTEQVHAGFVRVSGTEETSGTVQYDGVFGGLTLGSRRFDFTPDGLPLITGKLAPEVSGDEAFAMVSFSGRRATAVLRSITIKTLSGFGKARYELLSLGGHSLEGPSIEWSGGPPSTLALPEE
jgi:hypothetical protein